MSTSTASMPIKYTLKQFRLPQTVIARFVAHRTVRSAAMWALVFGVYVVSKADGFVTAYPSPQSRVKVVASFANNIGIKAILGAPPHTSSVAALAAWNTLIVMVMVGAIWGYLAATRVLRGEEQAGRWEILLAGQTTARRAAANVLAGLGASLVVMYIISAAAFIGIGKIHSIDFGVSSGLYFALAVTVGSAMFMAVGAVTAELMPTRARAASLATVAFGISFLIRVMADTTSARWLLNLTPLGWIEKMQPLSISDPIWLLPDIVLIGVLVGLCVFLAGRRDLGSSTFADKDSARPHFKLLGSPLSMTLRLTRNASLSWLAAVGLVSFFFGILTKPAADAFSQSASLERALNNIAHSSQVAAASTFLGIFFFMSMIIIMSYTASGVGAIREDEAEGYLDNLLVRKVRRLDWLWGRISLIVAVIALAGVLSGLCTWLALINQHLGISFHTLMMAGFNTMTPAVFTLGLGVFCLGILPRLTTVIAYGVIAWSFLITMISSGVKINHWLLDTSVLQHITLAPATNPDWGSAAIIVGLGAALCIIGSLVFNARDLESE